MQKINDILMVEGIGYDSNIYIFEDIIVDTGSGENIQYLWDSLKKADIKLDDLALIINTHNHYDHIGGNVYFDLEVAMHHEDASALAENNSLASASWVFGKSLKNMKVDRHLQEGDRIHEFEVIHTPGHTRGGICLYDGENLISGDTVFAGGGFGRTDLGGNMADLKSSLHKISNLEVDYLLPGHGPATSEGSKHIKLAYNILKRY